MDGLETYVWLKIRGWLGFQKFEQVQYNVALLAKQGWRLLTNPSSLAAQVFKARYYPHGTVTFLMQKKLEQTPATVGVLF